MIAVVLEWSDTAAVVELRPGWLGRLWGAATTRAELRRSVQYVRCRNGVRQHDVMRRGPWRYAATDRPVLAGHHGAEIARALDCAGRAQHQVETHALDADA